MPRRKDLHEVILRLLSAARAAQEEDPDLVLHHLDRALQLLGHRGLAAEEKPDYPPEVRAFVAALIREAGRSAEEDALVFLGALSAEHGEASYAVA